MDGLGFRQVMVLLALNVALLRSAPVHASLGHGIGSVIADQRALPGSLELQVQPAFTVARISNDAGMRLIEYLNPEGTVFALSWSGPGRPNLQQILGRAYDDYVATLGQQAALGRQRSLSIVAPSVVVRISGHMRAYAGQAYLPALCPAGFSFGEPQ